MLWYFRGFNIPAICWETFSCRLMIKSQWPSFRLDLRQCCKRKLTNYSKAKLCIVENIISKCNDWVLFHTHTPLLLYYMLKPGHHLIWGKWAKAKPGASRLQSWDDLWQVVADQTKPSVFCKLLNYWNAKRGNKLMLQYRHGLNTLQ